MPAGVSMGQYLAFMTAAFASMALGAQTVHMYYRPMADLDKYIENEVEKLPTAVQEDVKVYIKTHR